MSVAVSPAAGSWNYSYTDTLNLYVERANEFVWFGNADGYLSGTSRGGFSEVGQHFDFVGQGRITKLICHFANRWHVGNDADTFQFKIYDAGLNETNYSGNYENTYFTDSVPITLLGSQYFAADSMNFGDYWIRRETVIEFENPPVVNSSFIVSLNANSELANDTIALWHSIIGDGQQEYRTVRLMNDFGEPQDPDTAWIRDKYWRPSFDVDLMISPVLEIDTLSTITGITEVAPISLAIAPNPANGSTNISWKGDDAAFLEIYRGSKLVQSQNIAGLDRINLNLEKLGSGMFTIRIRRNDGLLLGSDKLVSIR